MPVFPGVFDKLLKSSRVKLTVKNYGFFNVFNTKSANLFVLVEKCRNCYNSNIEENAENETAGFKGFGEPGAHILCALFVGCYEFCNSVFDIRCNICCSYCHNTWQSCDKSYVFSVVFDWCSHDFGRIFKARTPAGTNNFCKNKIIKRKNPAEAGFLNE